MRSPSPTGISASAGSRQLFRLPRAMISQPSRCSKRFWNWGLLFFLLLPLIQTGCAKLSCHRMCAPLAPRAIEYQQLYSSDRLLDGQPQIERGKARPVIDTLGWIVGIPDKILLWDRRVSNHSISPQTEEILAAYLDQNELSTVRVRLNQYRPLDDWRRLIRNDSVGPLWRLTFGSLTVLGETLIPGRIFGGDHYNPYTDTIHIYSDVPAIALHEGGHAKDFGRRKWKGTYAFAYTLPIVPLYHESVASGDALAYLDTYGSPEDRAAAAKILYPAYGTYVGSAAGTVAPNWSAPLYYGSLISGHVLGRYQARQIVKNARLPSSCVQWDGVSTRFQLVE